MPLRAQLPAKFVTTDMVVFNNHFSEQSFDGNRSTFFWSEGDVSLGNHLTVHFIKPMHIKTVAVYSAEMVVPRFLIEFEKANAEHYGCIDANISDAQS